MLTIVAIDDDLQNLELVKALVGSMGYHVMVAQSGEDGKLLIEQVLPALVLLDLRLPGGMDGWQLATTVKATPTTAHIPIIAMSVAINADDQRRAKEARCSLFLSKPFHLSALRKYIKQFVENL